MKTDTFMKLLSILEEAKKEDDKISKATEQYFSEVYPDSYAPYQEGKLSKCLDVLFIFEPDIYRDLEYYFYEAPNMDEATIFFDDWRKYDFCKRKEMIQYMKDEKYIN